MRVSVTLSVCGSECTSDCPRSKNKTTSAINTNLGTHIVHGRISSCIDFEVERSKVSVTRL